MHVRLLGPVDITVDGQARALPGLRRKALVAALALHAGRVVSADRLTELVWDSRPPPGAAQTLQSHVSQLRRFLGEGVVIRLAPPGYVMELPGEGTDVRSAQRLICEGTTVRNSVDGARVLREAVGLWRGRPLAELAGWAWFDDQARWLDSLHAQATRALTEHRLALGEHAALVAELRSMAREQPLDEDLHRQLMLALYRAGRQAESLTAYRELRALLVGELGIEPGADLRDLEQAILRQDPALAWTPPRDSTITASRPPAPRQLPLPEATFSDRRHELAPLDGLPHGMEVLRIRLLGGFEVCKGQRVVPARAWRLRKAKTLVKLLALEPAHRLHRDQLVDRLWPELDVEAARNNLHQVLHSTRRALSTVGIDGAAALVLRDDVVALVPDGGLVIDLEELRERVEEARRSRDTAALADALRSQWAPLLPEDTYEPWVQEHVSRLREWRLGTLLHLVEDDLTRLDAPTAVALLAPEIATNPLHEPLHRAMMRALNAAGRRAEALVLFERLRSALDRELAAEPNQQTRALYRELLANRTGDVEVGGEEPVVNLPARVVPLVGRERELEETAQALSGTRLLTLTGPGGAGKTSLAIELARRAAGRYPGGAFLVELGAVFDGALVVSQLAAALQLQLPSPDAPLDALVAQLRDRRLLVVLDNCEHLLDACARTVRELLRGCPGLTVLATSREPLRIEGELTWRTPSLALADPEHLPALEVLADVASVQLFVQRAAAVTPGFALTGENAAAVAAICYRLDGIPLALELAAACTPALSPQQIAARLSDALSLLRRGHRGTITRQRTLAATLAWSHDLLADAEKTLLRRLAVFAGSFTLETAEAVGGESALGALARLVDTSLVLAESHGDTTRYRLLDTVRQYATEKLRAAGEEATVRSRHCEWYVEFSEARDPEVANVDIAPASLDVEHDNLRAALAWALENEPQSALRLAVALWQYWLARGLFAEGRRWLEAALAAVPQPSPMRARALLALAVFDVRRGTDRRLAGIGAQTIAAADGGMARGLALAEDGVLAYMGGRWNECWQRSVEARTSCQGAPEIEAASAHLQALVLLGRGKLSQARHAFRQTQAALGRVDSPRPCFRTLMLGFAVERDGLSPRVYFEETVLRGPRVSAAQAQGYVLCNLAYLARLAGESDEAGGLVEEAVELFVGLGDRDGEALALNHLGCLHRVHGEYAAGRAALERSLLLRRRIGDRRAAGLTVSNLGVLAVAAGDHARGLALLKQALDGFGETRDTPGRVGTSLTLASVLARRGDHEAARRLLVGTLPEAPDIPGNHRATAWAWTMLSDTHHRLGEFDAAARASDHAATLFQALGSSANDC